MPKIESGVRARALSMKRTARRLPVGPFRTALLAGGCAAVLLSFSPEPLRAAWPEKFCETIKLQTTVAYFRCLTNVYKRANRRDRESNLEDAIEACDGGFDRGFDVAEALGDCGPVGGPATLREQIRAQVLQNVAAVTANAGCQNLSITTDEAASCLVGTTTTAIDLATLLDQLNEQGEDVDETTRIYIQAWGGSGSHGNTSNGGSGAKGGYAQLVTTVGDIVAGSGSALLYYYLGLNGTVAANAGGDGGTASIVALDDLTETAATESNVLLLAGGGGGGGAGRGKDICGDFDERIFGGNGGEGGEAFAETGATVVKAGGDGSAADGITGVSGDGGSTAARGTGGKAGSPGSALAGDNDMAPVGGAGGNHTPASVGFYNQTTGIATTAGGGRGGNGGDDAGGGGGGGGFGGGGGGVEGDGNTNCVTGGGGGGGSFVNLATAVCAGAPTSAPANPNGTRGAVQITVDLGVCG